MVEARKLRRRLVAIVAITVVAAGTLIPTANASAGKDYGSLTATWWQWVYSQQAKDVGGTNTNPVLDSTGAYGDAGQKHGIGPGHKYFFLTGTFGAEVTRTVTVPDGKALFFPIINVETDNAVDPLPPQPFKVPELRAQAKASIDSAIQSSLTATLDGQPVDFFRTTSPVFSYTLPKTNSIYAYFGLTGPQFQGRIHPAVSDGYWAYVPPLPDGKHVLEFTSANTSGFSLHVTYNLTVK